MKTEASSTSPRIPSFHTYKKCAARGYKCIAASSYNYKAVLIGLVDAFKAGKLGGEVIPMNFSNGGFVWEWNEAKCAEKITPEIRKAVEDKLAQFKAQPNLVANYSEVDYTKL